MSKETNKSAYQLLRKKDRTIEDYIELFSGRNIDEEEVTTATNDRYKRLYNLSKINQAKAELYRQKMKEQRDIEELAECSFAPKINKGYKYKEAQIIINKNLYTDKSKRRQKTEDITDQIVQDLLKRQEEWVNKKNNKIERKKIIENNRVKNELIFSPEINRNYQKVINDMRIETQEIVADPESYKEFIDRNKKNLQNFSKNISTNNIIIKDYNKNKKSLNNNKYDYTEHKLLNKNIIKNISFNKDKNNLKSKGSKSVDSKRSIIKKCIPISKSKINKIKNEDIYSMVYFDSKEKYENRINDGFSEEEKKNIFNGKTQVEFKEALDTLHNCLINLDIFDDNDDNLDENNLNAEEEN